VGAVMQIIEVDVDGRRERVPVARAAGRMWFHWRGQTYVIDAGASRGRRAGGPTSRAGTGNIAAPMPGKITRVGVELGDTVTKGQVLVVMEAMKMEYTLQADVDGLVSEVSAVVHTNVAQGAILVKVIPQ